VEHVHALHKHKFKSGLHLLSQLQNLDQRKRCYICEGQRGRRRLGAIEEIVVR
jgi:hypothetical protein